MTGVQTCALPISDFQSVGVGAYMGQGGQPMGAYMNPAALLRAPAAPAATPAQTLRAKQMAGLGAYMNRSRMAG